MVSVRDTRVYILRIVRTASFFQIPCKMMWSYSFYCKTTVALSSNLSIKLYDSMIQRCSVKSFLCSRTYLMRLPTKWMYSQYQLVFELYFSTFVSCFTALYKPHILIIIFIIIIRKFDYSNSKFKKPDWYTLRHKFQFRCANVQIFQLQKSSGSCRQVELVKLWLESTYM